MGNISQSKRTRAIKAHATYWEYEQSILNKKSIKTKGDQNGDIQKDFQREIPEKG